MAETKKKIVDIYPSKLTKRFLVFLADVVLNLILSIFLFEIIVMPISKAAVNYNEKYLENVTNTKQRLEILYGNDILFYDEKTIYDLNKNLTLTGDKFIEFYSFKETKTNEIFYHYFVEIRENNVNYLNELYTKYGEEYFDKEAFTSLNTYKLKEEYIAYFEPKYNETDEISKDGQTKYDQFFNRVFLNIYREIFSDIQKNNLVLKGNSTFLSYNDYSKLLSDFDKYYTNLITIDSFIAFYLSGLILFIIVPQTNHKRRTVSEIILKVEHVHKDVSYLTRLETFIVGFFDVLNASSILLFTPVITLGFGNAFVLKSLVGISLVALAFVTIEMIIMCTTKLYQSLKELITRTFVTDTDNIDEYYREKYSNDWKFRKKSKWNYWKTSRK